MDSNLKAKGICCSWCISTTTNELKLKCILQEEEAKTEEKEGEEKTEGEKEEPKAEEEKKEEASA